MAFPILDGHNFMSLKTFRKSGKDVPTPVWFAEEGDSLFVVTNANSGKVKRIRNNTDVEITPCDMRGGLLGEDYIPATAIIVTDGNRQKLGYRLLRKKYGLQFRLFMFFARLRRQPEAILKITSRPAA